MRIHIIEPLAVKKEEMDKFTETFTQLGHELVIYDDRNENPEEIIRRSSGLIL